MRIPSEFFLLVALLCGVVDAQTGSVGTPSSAPTGAPTSAPTSFPTMPTSEPTALEANPYLSNFQSTTIFEDYRLWVVFGIVFVSFTCVIPGLIYSYSIRNQKTEEAINQYFTSRRDEIRRAEEGALGTNERSEFRERTLKETFRRTYGKDVDEQQDTMSAFMSPKRHVEYEVPSETDSVMEGATTIYSTRLVNKQTAAARAKQILRPSPKRDATKQLQMAQRAASPQKAARTLGDALASSSPRRVPTYTDDDMSDVSDFRTSIQAPTKLLGSGAGSVQSQAAGSSADSRDDDFLSSLARTHQMKMALAESKQKEKEQSKNNKKLGRRKG